MTAWTPGMRDEAAVGIVRLLARSAWAGSDAAPDLREALRKLSEDPSPVVRMQAAHGLLLIDVGGDPLPTNFDRLRSHILDETDEQVLAVQLQLLAQAMATTPAADVDQLIEELAARPQGRFLHRDEPDGEPVDGGSWGRRSAVVEWTAAIVARLAVVYDVPFSASRLSDWLARPLRNADRTETLIRQFRPYLNPVDGSGQEAAFSHLATVAHSAQTTWRAATTAQTVIGEHAARADADKAARIAYQIAEHLNFASSANDEQHGANSKQAAQGSDTVFADYAFPLLRTLGSVQHPQVTQPVVQTLIRVGRTHPNEALLAVADAVPETGPYVADPLAASTICTYLTRLLAENRDLVLGTEPGIAAFRHLLHSFAGAGDASALALAYTFSDTFR
jgi:hypothetical protein